MEETIILIILAIGLGNYLDDQKPIELLYELENGQIVETSVYKNNDYFCPVYCESSHKHIGHFSNLDCGMDDKCYHFNHPEYLANLSASNDDDTKLADGYNNNNNIFAALLRIISGTE